MRVALEGRTLQQSPLGGVGRMVQQLAKHLAAKGVEVHVLLDGALPVVEVDGTAHVLRVAGVRSWLAWLQIAVPRWLRDFDGVFHGTFNGLPFLQSVPSVVTIHDLTFVSRPEWFSAGRRFAFRSQAWQAARSAGCVVAVSGHVKEEVVRHYRLDPDRVLVAPNAVDATFAPQPTPESTAPVPPRVVALGGAYRRHPELAIAAWRIARGKVPDLTLTVVNAPSLPPEPGLESLGPVPNEQLAALLGGAVAFLYPTEYEGFGMPGLEAISCGTPVIAAPVGALPEVLGEAACWVDAPTPELFAAALQRLVEDDEFLARKRRLALERAAAAPGWSASADVYIDAYTRALAG